MSMLEIRQLNKAYGSHRALTDLDLVVPEGGIFGLLGPNGAGKTTLIRIINQIIEQDSGEVILDGQHLTSEAIRKIGYLPEERGLYKKMAVWDQLIYFSRIKGLTALEAKQRVTYWLEKFEISSWKNKKIEDLSKGMAQKIQFIATVIHSPRVLILDEPFSGFDPVNAALLKNEILDLKKAGTTILLSTHRMESVELLCDQVAMIHKSKKILDGSIREIKSRFRPLEIQASLNKLSQELPAIWKIEVSEEGRVDLLLPLNGQSPNQLLHELMTYGEVIAFKERFPSMEEIFIQQVNASAHA
ncbi:MAG: ATP-binding cassette domain-containing protein [Bacteroidetes bacterium]|nr:ATP-binding cassette domain-containing protein [Bacteroidota bacterium]MDA1268323.1 ATP-binding cassette domain-containing protein [Bacteroidota bacterium]